MLPHKIKTLLTCTIAAFVMSGGANAQDKWHWKIQSNLLVTEPGYVALKEKFADLATKMSGGRITFDVFPVGALFPVKDGLEAVGSGLVEMATLTGGYYAGKIGSFANLETGVPGALRTPFERYNFFYRKGFIDLAREAYGKYGIYYLGPQLSPQWDIISKVPITSVADFKGLKIRSYGLEAEWYQSMGAIPVFMGAGEIYTGLATGVIDAARYSSPAGNYGNSFYEVAKYYVRPSPLPVPNNFFAVNQQAWDTLPDDIKAILQEAAVASSFDYLTLGSLKDAQAMQKMLEAGEKISVIPPEEYAKMEAEARKLWRNYAKDGGLSAQGVKMLDDYLAELGR